jgi:hypothetical protein
VLLKAACVLGLRLFSLLVLMFQTDDKSPCEEDDFEDDESSLSPPL